jgi:hypothetical protein
MFLIEDYPSYSLFVKIKKYSNDRQNMLKTYIRNNFNKQFYYIYRVIYSLF